MTRLIGAAVVVLAFATPGSDGAFAQCRAGTADAAMYGGTSGDVHSSHFGRNTKFNCIIQRNMALKTEVHNNGYPSVDLLHQGPLEYLGSSMTKDFNFTACTGTWDSSTRFGTLNAGGVPEWLAYDISNIIVASCPPPPPPCGGMYEDTSTFTLGADGPRLAKRQLGLALSRSEERPEGFYFFDEWAMLGVREAGMSLRLSSTREFKERLGEVRDSYRPVAARARRVLVIMAGNHPHNSRHVPVPSFVPMQVDLNASAGGSGQPIAGELWFRAELAPTGEVDRLIVLESSVPVAEQYLHEAIRENLALRFETEKRHRVVVFALGRVDAAGLLSVKDAVVVPPPCCCGGQICY
jgi:hypothetical protein